MLSIADYLALSVEERQALFPQPVARCVDCQRAVSTPGSRCEDCYFDALGDLVERSPIGRGISGPGAVCID